MEGENTINLDKTQPSIINDSIRALFGKCQEVTVTFVPENLDPIHPFRDSQVHLKILNAFRKIKLTDFLFRYFWMEFVSLLLVELVVHLDSRSRQENYRSED